MSVHKNNLIAALTQNLPHDIVAHMVDEYLDIKRRFYLRQYRPSELNGGRFGECVARILQYLHTNSYTPFGTYLGNTDSILNSISSNTTQSEAFRVLIPKITRVLLDVRNKRNVAHVGGEVDPNYSDSIFVSHAADWIMTEVVRHFYSCSPDEARRIVANINEVRIPVVTEVDGFVRVQNTSLDARDKTLVVLYYKQPMKVADTDLVKWILYANPSRYKNDILTKMHAEALVHYESGHCTLLPKGITYVEKNIAFDLLV